MDFVVCFSKCNFESDTFHFEVATHWEPMCFGPVVSCPAPRSMTWFHHSLRQPCNLSLGALDGVFWPDLMHRFSQTSPMKHILLLWIRSTLKLSKALV